MPVTGDHLLAAWAILFGPTDPMLAHIEVVPPDENDHHAQHLLKRIRRLLENDRQRCAERGAV